MKYYLVHLDYTQSPENAQNRIWRRLSLAALGHRPGYNNLDRKFCTVFLRTWVPERCIKAALRKVLDGLAKPLDVYPVDPEMHMWNTSTTLREYLGDI